MYINMHSFAFLHAGAGGVNGLPSSSFRPLDDGHYIVPDLSNPLVPSSKISLDTKQKEMVVTVHCL